MPRLSRLAWTLLSAALVVALLIWWNAERSELDSGAPVVATAKEAPVVDAPTDAFASEKKLSVRIPGSVVDPLGNVVTGARIVAWAIDDTGDASRQCRSEAPRQIAFAESDDDGAFELALAEEERFCVRAHDARWGISEPQVVSTGEAPTEFIQLTLLRPIQFNGRVIDYTNAPQANVRLTLARRDGPSTGAEFHAQSDGEGRFSFDGLDAGEYVLSSADGRYAISRPREVVLRADEQLDELIVRADPVAIVTGRLLDAEGRPAVGVRVTARSAYDPQLILGSTTTDSVGAFELHCEHRSEAAVMAQRMAGGGLVDKRGVELPRAPLPAALVCIEFEHPALQGESKRIELSDSRTDIGPMYLRARDGASVNDSLCR